MSYTDQWLSGLAIHKTRAGVRLDLRLYIYPDGHGNIHYNDIETNADANLPVDSPEKALEAFRSIWEQARKHGLQVTEDES